MTCDPQQLIEAIQDVLLPEDLGKGYKHDPACPVAGHCSVAAEVLQALLWECGERQWKARYAPDPAGGTHWWLTDGTTILDPTAEQYTYYGKEPPYADVRSGGGFQGTRWPVIDGKKVRKPSPRVLPVISRLDLPAARAITERFQGRTAALRREMASMSCCGSQVIGYYAS